MQDICRAITFYNNILPATEEEQDWKYCAWGIVDGIAVSKNLEPADGKILDRICREKQELRNGLNGQYMAQQIYAVRYGDLKEDEMFWGQDEEEKKEGIATEYPFLFFVRIQLEQSKEEFFSARTDFEEALSLENRTKVLIYLTYDNLDALLVIRAANYNDGVSLIDALGSNLGMTIDGKLRVLALKKSFSVFAVKHEWIDKLEDAEIKKYDTQKIDCACFSIRENQNNKAEEIEKKLRGIIKNNEDETNERSEGRTDNVIRMPVLGVDDEQINVYNIGWGTFLKLYDHKKGIFCNANTEYRPYWAGVTTSIRTKITPIIGDLEAAGITVHNETESSSDKKPKNYYADKIGELREKVNALRNEIPENPYTEDINVILNSLSRYQHNYFHDYVFFPILEPLNVLLDLMQKADGQFEEDYFKFLKGFCMYVQGSFHSDRYSIQSIDFNSKIFDIPEKLNCFYNAYMHEIKTMLCVKGEEEDIKDKHTYEFLVLPGLSEKMSVEELYPGVSNEKRLMKVELPQIAFYDFRTMMIILAHETAHYVGKKYRMRPDRYNSVLRSFSHIFVKYVRFFCEKNRPGDRSLWEEKIFVIEEKMYTMLIEALTRNKNPEYWNHRMKGFEQDIKDQMLKNETDEKYFFKIKTNTKIAMIDIVQQGLEPVFSPLRQYALEDDYDDLLELIREAAERFIAAPYKDSTLLSMETVWDMLEYIYKECFADMIAIEILGLKPAEYINAMINSAKQQRLNVDNILDSNNTYRISIVLLCMMDEKLSLEKQKAALLNGCKDDCQCEKVMKRALMVLGKYLFQDSDSGQYDENEVFALRDHITMRNVYWYLKNCKKSFSDDLNEMHSENINNEDGPKSVIENIKAIFSGNSKSEEERIINMERFINHFKQGFNSENE